MKQVIFLVNLILIILLVGCQSQTQAPEAKQGQGQFTAKINNITVKDGSYAVDYAISGFTECPNTQDCMHVHIFYNNVPAEKAVVPADGPWELYYGPSPFAGVLQVANRPAGATQLCILVANADHTGYTDSGNCVDLPE